MVNSGAFDGSSEEGEASPTPRRSTGGEPRQFQARDWLISRQRYWGAPIPIIHCARCGIVPVPEKDLPVVLPDQVAFKPTGQSPLLSNEAFLKVDCPKCGGAARRETETMDTFVDSSWYFMRFLSPRLETAPFDKDAVNRWLPVNQYIGGVEHAILHLLYSRFIVKVLRDLGLSSRSLERLFTQDDHEGREQDVEVEGERGPARCADSALRSGHGAPLHALHRAAGKDAEWNDEESRLYRFHVLEDGGGCRWSTIGEGVASLPRVDRRDVGVRPARDLRRRPSADPAGRDDMDRFRTRRQRTHATGERRPGPVRGRDPR